MKNTGLLCCKSHYNHVHIFVHKDLRLKILYISHHSMVAGHTGCAWVYSTLRRSFHWAFKIIEAYKTFRNFLRCAK